MGLPKQSHILITGASGAIGSALALAYANPGTTLYLQGRQEAPLKALAAACEGKGAEVVCQMLELRDSSRLVAWLNSLPPLDLVIINAGMNTYTQAANALEPWDEAEALLDVNLKAAMLIVHTVLPAMRLRNRGQIALISSLAACFGLPVTPTYCASKAALKVYGEALRGRLAKAGIRVNVVMPGYVTSPMCQAMPGPKPFEWSAERAARVIRRGLARDQARIAFPFPLALGSWFLGVLPVGLSLLIVQWLGYDR